MPRADHELALNKIKKFEEAEAKREDEAINAAVDAAIEAGKIAPASRDEGGLERFQKMVEARPGSQPKAASMARKPRTRPL